MNGFGAYPIRNAEIIVTPQKLKWTSSDSGSYTKLVEGLKFVRKYFWVRKCHFANIKMVPISSMIFFVSFFFFKF